MKVCIDAGHGPGNTRKGVFDSGAVSRFGRESQIAYCCALTLAAAFERIGVDTHLTRATTTDENPVSGRAKRAKEAGCSVFISLHLNAADAASANGVETFFRDIRDKELARIVQAVTVRHFGGPDRGVKRDLDGGGHHRKLAVLDFDGDAALIELGFVTNAGDVAEVTNEAKQTAWAAEIAAAVAKRYVQ